MVFEFAGVPKAGKTTTIGQLHAFLKRCGFKVETVVERASVCPIRDKKHANFNVWTACTTLSQILEKTQTPPRPDDPDVLILDRGLFDSICWMNTMERLSRLRSEDLEAMERFLRLDDWRKRISAVFLMTASPEDSMEREQGDLPVSGASGSIMNTEVLAQTLRTNLQMADRLKNDFQIHVIDTSSEELRQNRQKMVETVADLALTIIDEQLQEKILHVSRSEVVATFGTELSLSGDEGKRVSKCFSEKGAYLPREHVEADLLSVQALPVVIVRNKSGDVLRLRRKEAKQDNSLHQKLVIWAGGHVREEDGLNGKALLRCASRELQEELRLSVEESELRFLGSIYVQDGGKTSQHVALVYEWRAETDDVAVALSNSEFFERRGNSLSGRFVPVEQLVEDARRSPADVEPWSMEILRTFLGQDAELPRLF